ncbi:hypothetical protein Trad_0360 [Truepera radiovictrix DSM 17093]|uniref:Uncharacterized protein n=2 Tax=Truepera TaxID=332248 RepID=D7CRK9_TRURR|nr:hypothetical protein Trad_0360 [Truepera radiovictrix DSM 17093]
MVQFIEEGVRQSVITFPTRDGRTLIIGYGEGFETATFDLQVTDFQADELDTSLLLDYVNPFPSCGSPPAPGAKFARIVGWEREDRNEDGYLDLVINVSTLSVEVFPCDATQAFYKATLQPHNVEQVVFLFDGQAFTATPEAERLKAFSQAPQGATRQLPFKP